MTNKNTLNKAAIILSVLALTACSDLTAREQRMLTGAAAGTTVGAIGTVMMGGCVACGAAVGGVVGTGAGYLVDYVKTDGSGGF